MVQAPVSVPVVATYRVETAARAVGSVRVINKKEESWIPGAPAPLAGLRTIPEGRVNNATKDKDVIFVSLRITLLICSFLIVCILIPPFLELLIAKCPLEMTLSITLVCLLDKEC